MDIEKVLLVGIQESYNNLKNYDLLEEDKLYFCTDTKNLYKGYDLYTDAIRHVINKPANIKDIAVGKIYYISSTNTLEYYDDKLRKWVLLRPRIVGGIEVEYKTDNSGNIIFDDYGEPLEEYLSDEYINTIPTSLAVYNLIKTQIDKNNNSGHVATGLTTGDRGGQLRLFLGDRKEEIVQLKGLLMYPHKVYTIGNDILATDSKGNLITRIQEKNNKDKLGNVIKILPDVLEYQLLDGSWKTGNVIEQNVYPVTGSDKPLMNPDIHVDPNNPNNGFNSKKSRYEFYLTDGTRIILPIGGTVGEVGEADGGVNSNGVLPNYTKFVTVEGGTTPSATNSATKEPDKIIVYTDVNISQNPNNSLYIDGYINGEGRIPEDNEGLYDGLLVWMDKTGYIHWINPVDGKHYSYNRDIISNEYVLNQEWIDYNDIRYRVISENSKLKVRWEDNVYVTDSSGDIFSINSDEDTSIDGEDIDNDNEESVGDEIDDIWSDEDSGGDDIDDSDEDDGLNKGEDQNKPLGTPVNIIHWVQSGIDSRTEDGVGTAYHCFKHASGEHEVDSQGRTLLYYYTSDNKNVYKYYSKTISTPTTNPDGTPGTPVITYDVASVLYTGPINAQVFKHFSLDRFDFDKTLFEAESGESYKSGLMVDLTPYTKLPLFWQEVKRIDERLDQLNKKIDDEIKILHDLLKIEEF